MAYALYEQRTGTFRICEIEDGGQDRVLYSTVGYSGRNLGRDNPSLQAVKNIGPIPVGFYYVTLKAHPRFRPPAYELSPYALTNTHGRAGFWIHGDSFDEPGHASHGCIVIGHAAREWIEHYGVRRLEVISGDVDVLNNQAA